MKYSVPEIKFPGISQDDFQYAFDVLEFCKVDGASEANFPNPFFAPGGAYGPMWWQLDSSLALCGYKWVDQKFCEQSLLNFITAQKEDGRIALWGKDSIPRSPIHSKQAENVSSLPKIFDVSYQVIRRSSDSDFIQKIYAMLQKYLAWWFAERQDAETKLMSAVFEETFIPYLGWANEVAAVDTNVEVAWGCSCLTKIADMLGKSEDSSFYLQQMQEITNGVRNYLWDGQAGAFALYSLKDKKHVGPIMASTFYAMRMGIATPEQKSQLLKLMLDNERFNWNVLPLTSVDMNDPEFTTVKGSYTGNPCWSGSVWTLINEGVVRALKDADEKQLAANLALKTVRMFNHNCAEFLHPFDGSGEGVIKYAWSASQYIELLLGYIFGIDYNAADNTVSINPMIDSSMYGETISISGIEIPGNRKLSVSIECRELPEIKCSLMQPNGESTVYVGTGELKFSVIL